MTSQSTSFAEIDALYPLPPEELPRQWVLAPSAEALPDAWEAHALRGWHFAAHPDAELLPLRARDGSPLGWVLAVLAQLGPDGDRVPSDALTLPVGADPLPAELEAALYGRNAAGVNEHGHGLEGAWTALVIAPSLRRVYVNPTGGLVYSPERRTVAVTYNLIPGLERDLEVSQAFNSPAAQYFYTYGLTSHRGLHRLLPNHYLDLDTFEAQRHWPTQRLPPFASGEEGVHRIVVHARRVLAALSGYYEGFNVGLTAGYDSRAALSILRPLVIEGVDVSLTTKIAPTEGHRVDVAGAKRLARIAGLPHRVQHTQPGEKDNVARYYVRIGEARGGRFIANAAGDQGDAEGTDEARRLTLHGGSGEIGRGKLWVGKG